MAVVEDPGPDEGSEHELAAGEVEVELRDGSRVLVRPIGPHDREALREGFDRLSSQARYQRFMTAMPRLTEAQLTYLTEVDHTGHEALVAFDRATGDGVGVARFVRGEGEPVAEAAVTVIDDWQGRGLGTALTRMLAERARAVGVERFTAILLTANEPMRALITDLGPSRVVGRDGSVVEIEVDLPEEGVGDHITGVLRVVARGDAELATPPGRPPSDPGWPG